MISEAGLRSRWLGRWSRRPRWRRLWSRGHQWHARSFLVCGKTVKSVAAKRVSPSSEFISDRSKSRTLGLPVPVQSFNVGGDHEDRSPPHPPEARARRPRARNRARNSSYWRSSFACPPSAYGPAYDRPAASSGKFRPPVSADLRQRHRNGPTVVTSSGWNLTLGALV